jgi:lipid-binding SYLF domain-containing protein
MKRRNFLTASAIALAMAMTGCSTTPATPAEASAKKQSIDAGVDATLQRLYTQAPGSHELVNKAVGVLVFPSVLAGGIVVGGEYGEGALRSGGKTVGYYSTATGSLGLTLGAQSKSIVFLFMTKEAYDKFRASSGWTAGADASVALAKVGAGGKIDTTTATAPVTGLVLVKEGLMFNLSLDGTKVSPLKI